MLEILDGRVGLVGVERAGGGLCCARKANRERATQDRRRKRIREGSEDVREDEDGLGSIGDR
jgi:hypothetical protein